MITPELLQLHYRCVFDIYPVSEGNENWSEILKTIRLWIKEKTNAEQGLIGKWFFTGGKWSPINQPKVFVETIQEIGDGNELKPQYWALRYEHPDSDIKLRRWQTDIGVTVIKPNTFRFVLTISHWFSKEYVGEEKAPLPSAPKIVKTLLASKKWKAYVGSEQMHLSPMAVNVGDGKQLLDRLSVSDRRCPIVYVSRDYHTGEPLIDTIQLAKLLIGTATVYVAASSEVDKELEWLFPRREFRCWNGMVRIYQPRVYLESENDAKRHRFFTADDIKQYGSENVLDMIVRGLARRSMALMDINTVATCDDVSDIHRELRFKKLKQESGGSQNQEWISLLEKDNNRLETELKDFKIKITQLEERIDDLENDNESLNDDSRRFTYNNRQLSEANEDIKLQLQERVSKIETIMSLSKLPDSLSDVVDMIEKIHRDRIVFTERAKKSARDASFNDVNKAWECLWAMSTILYDLFFQESNSESHIAKEWQKQTKFELAMTEGKQTKKDRKLCTLRTDEYKGKEIDITLHVKYGSKEPKLLRVHFCPDPEERRIIVGHCGDHLDTYGTQFKK